MLSSLASIATLMLSTLLMMAGFGLMGYMLPIRSLNEGWSTVIISVIAINRNIATGKSYFHIFDISTANIKCLGKGLNFFIRKGICRKLITSEIKEEFALCFCGGNLH